MSAPKFAENRLAQVLVGEAAVVGSDHLVRIDTARGGAEHAERDRVHDAEREVPFAQDEERLTPLRLDARTEERQRGQQQDTQPCNGRQHIEHGAGYSTARDRD